MAIGVSGQLGVLGAGLCLDDVNLSVLLPGQCAPHTPVDFHHLGFSRCVFIGTHLNTCNRDSLAGLWFICWFLLTHAVLYSFIPPR